MDPTMTSDLGGTSHSSSPVVKHLMSVLFSKANKDDDPFEQEVSDYLYTKYFIDEKQSRMVRAGGLFDDSPTMETEYFFIEAHPLDSDFGSDEGEPESSASEEEGKRSLGEEGDSEDGSESDDGMNYGGCWMLFFSTSIIDDMWKRACRLLWDGSLEGVESILVSTSRRNPRASNDGNSVMLFHSGPWSDETFMQYLGHHIAIQMSYFSYTKYLRYKPHYMIVRGTRATGSLYNSLIRIPVPSNILDVLEKKKRLHRILNKQKLYQQWLMDQRVDLQR